MTVRVTDGQRGSIPLALLVIIALSGVMGALALTVVGSTQQVRFDQDYTAVIQVADAGAQAGASELVRSVPQADLECVQPACATYTGNGVTTDVDGNAVAYEWSADKVSPLAWEVTSTSTIDGVERQVVVTVADQARFFLAAFSDQGLRTAGGNGADSFGAGAWYTGNGIVASNADISIKGSTTVNGVQLYNWRDDRGFDRCDDDGGFDSCAAVFGGCGSAAQAGCGNLDALPDPIPPSARFDDRLEVGGPLLQTAFIDDFLAEDCGPLGFLPLEDYTTSTYNGGNGRLGVPGTTTAYCFDDVTINDPLVIDGTVEIYVYGNLLITEPAGNKGNTNDNRLEANCTPGCTVGTDTPDARKLSFYVDDSGSQTTPSIVQIANQSAIAAGIYAPQSTCEGSPSNAQADIFGSLICRSITNEGGWGFHYDDRLGEMGTGEWAVRSWREEVPTP